MAIAFVQKVGVKGTSVSSVTSPSMTTTSGNLLHADCDCYSPQANAMVVTDSLTNTWSAGASKKLCTNANGYVQSNYVKNCTGGAGHTFTLSLGGSGYPGLSVIEISGADTSAPLDLAENVDTGGTNVQPTFTTAGTTAQAAEIAIGFLVSNFTGGNTITDGGGFTAAYDNFASGLCLHSAYKVLSATGTVTYAPSSSTSQKWGVQITTYKEATGGGTTTVTVDFICPAEFGTGLRADATSLDESGATFILTNTGPVEIAASIQADMPSLAASLGSFVTNMLSLVDSGATFRKDDTAALEFGRSIVADRTTPAEFAAGAAVQITVPCEFGGSGTSVLVDYSVGIEWGASLIRDLTAPSDVAEAIVAAASIVGTVAASLAADSTTPAGNIAAMQRDMTAAVEVLRNLYKDATIPVAFAVGLAADCIAQIEFSGSTIVITIVDPDGIVFGLEHGDLIFGAEHNDLIFGR